MGSWLLKGVLAATITLPALSGVARAQSTDNDGCSNATLQGDYAFSVLSLSPLNVVVGIGRFDGKGGFTQIDYPGDRLRRAGTLDFRTGQTGSYSVNPDCTGSQEIDLNVPNVPAGTSHGVIHNAFHQKWRPIHSWRRRRNHVAGSDEPVREPDSCRFLEGRVRAGKLKTNSRILSPSRCLLSADQGLIGAQPNRRNRSISVMTEEELPT